MPPPPPTRPRPKKKVAQQSSDVEMEEALETNEGPSTRVQKGKGKAVARDPPTAVESGSKRVLQESPTRVDISAKRTRTSRRVEEATAAKKNPDPVYLEGRRFDEDTFVDEKLVPAIVGKVNYSLAISRGSSIDVT